MSVSSIQLRHLPFLPIATDKKSFFGGHQMWYSKPSQSIKGCGPVACANIMAYVGFYHQGCQNLYPYKDLSQKSFVAHMDRLYEHIRPSVLGAYRAKNVAISTLTYGQSQGISLNYCKISSTESPDTILSFIAKSLKNDLPVAALLLHLPLFSHHPLGWHWVTITGLIYDNSIASLQLSNHGVEEYISFQDFYHIQHLWPYFPGSYVVFYPDSILI